MGDGMSTYVGTRGTISSTNAHNPILHNQGEGVAYAHNIMCRLIKRDLSNSIMSRVMKILTKLSITYHSSPRPLAGEKKSASYNHKTTILKS